MARDRAADFGQVNTATAAILVRVEDVADQPPVFVSVPGVTRIAEDAPRFTQVGRRTRERRPYSYHPFAVNHFHVSQGSKSISHIFSL